MSDFKVGDVVVHKSLGSQPLVIISMGVAEADIRFTVQGQYGLLEFRDARLLVAELETPIESIEREAEIFKTLNAKRDEINSVGNQQAGIKHLN